jgi:muramoyltetrapeptide carboxypeptidase
MHLPIYCFAPSGKTSDTDSSKRAIVLLESKGFTVHNHEVVERTSQRFAGTDQERVDEINDLVNIVGSIGPCIALATRGGYGISRLLSQIDWENLALAVDQGLKIVGHSDLTALQIALLSLTGRSSFAGPMLNYDFGSPPNDISEFTIKSFEYLINGEEFVADVQASQNFLNEPSFETTGILWGGNLTMLTSLIGTPYFPSQEFIKDGILFIEDVNEHPYRVERMLFQLLYAGILSTQSAILFGDFSDYKLSNLDDGYNLDGCISRIKRALTAMRAKTQILTDLPFGHCKDKLTLPVGKMCLLRATPSHYSLKSIQV